jgi:antitoxin VapB
MIDISQETETLAKRSADAQNMSPDALIRAALKARAHAQGVAIGAYRPRRRLSVAQMLAVGDEIAAIPLLDTPSPRAIMEDINAL